MTDDLAPAPVLGVIESVIGTADKLIERLATLRSATPADSVTGNPALTRASVAAARSRSPNRNAAAASRVGRDHRELITTEPSQRILSARLLAECAATTCSARSPAT